MKAKSPYNVPPVSEIKAKGNLHKYLYDNPFFPIYDYEGERFVVNPNNTIYKLKAKKR